VEVLRILDETLDAYFQLPIPIHRALLPDLTIGLDRSLQHYAAKAKSGCGKISSFLSLSLFGSPCKNSFH
jgi:hypothetical protein